MRFRAINSPLANKTLFTEASYVVEKFGLKAANDFLIKVEGLINLLQKDPFVFQNYKNNIYKVVVVKQITMFYTVEGNVIEVLLFWNTSKNPTDLKNML
jgi:uncharacterized membrane protein